MQRGIILALAACALVLASVSTASATMTAIYKCEAEAEWQVFKSGELRSGLQEHLAVLTSVAEQTVLTDDEVRSWMRAINAIRLVLGTRLDVQEDDEVDIDPSDPDAPAYALYEFLGYLLSYTLTALTGSR